MRAGEVSLGKLVVFGVSNIAAKFGAVRLVNIGDNRK